MEQCVSGYRFEDIAINVVERAMPEPKDKTAYIGLEHMDSGSLHISRWGSETDLIGEKLKIKKGDVLFARRNAYLKRVAIAPFDGLFSAHGMVLRPKIEVILPEFFPFFLFSEYFLNRAIKISVGSLSPTVNWKTLKQEVFNLPPLDEQKRIAELLWTADDVLQQRRNSLSCLYQIKEIITNEFVKEIASGIDEVYLGDLIEYASGQVDPKLEPYSKMPLVAPNHIESNTGNILKIETAEEQHAISGKYFFREGNVVYSKIRPSLNKVIIANFDGLCSADMYPITPKDKRISTRFLYYLLTSRIFVDYATRESVRTSIPKLNRTAMSKFKFAYMQPAKQAEFVQKLSTIDETIDSNLINIEETKNLLSQLIDRAMGGASDV